MKIFGKIIDIHSRSIFDAEMSIEKGIITAIAPSDKSYERFILPGLIDAHVHIESSMVTPSSFAVEAVKHGTVAVVSDPHEIANVCGIRGIDFMIENSLSVPMKFYFGAPSCVPATVFETNGASIDEKEIEKLLNRSEIHYLCEVMNYPGVINNDGSVIKKIALAKEAGKPIDGHAPELSGDTLKKYINAGITTDHECMSYEEAEEKILCGMKILIREGSAARNLDNLKELYQKYPDKLMLCSDDLHPEMLVKGHINRLVGKLISEGYNVFDVVRSATVNPAVHYSMNLGLLRVGDKADFIIVDSLEKMNVFETWIDGVRVFENGKVNFSASSVVELNNFNSSKISISDIKVLTRGAKVKVIEVFDGELFTKNLIIPVWKTPELCSDTEKDILKIVVKERYNDSPLTVGFIKGFGLNCGAFASSIAHDSHNIICVGVSDNDIVNAINTVVDMRGGLAVCNEDKISKHRLEIGGIMTSTSCCETAENYLKLNNQINEMGCCLKAPFMTLSFMALLVIPELKIGDKGLFDVNAFSITELFE